MKSTDLTKKLTLEEKASLCSGKNFWELKSVERLGLASIMVTDGPHGLRKQVGNGDHLGINTSINATCFPTASATANSFDRNLMFDIGKAIGEECLQEDVAVILGPGANIKRSPLCGRNFEYISEDPYATGEMSAAFIQGVQSQGVGTSLKHFALNNQEKRRMVGDSVADERAMREIYLAGFETAVKKAQPFTVMCSYNRVNGTYASENKTLLSDILRDEWGFEGLVVTDWGATNDRVEGIKAGLDLEMPFSGGYNDQKIIEAVKNGSLKEDDLDKVVTRIIDLILKTQTLSETGFQYDQKAHHALARKAAAESSVLLKNQENLLPLSKDKSYAVIGAFAKTPRYQGSGSSKINPHEIDTFVDILKEEKIPFTYAQGYPLQNPSESDKALIEEACEAAKKSDIAVIFAGLPDAYESEGFDRTDLFMPKSHTALIDAVASVNENVVVVLQLGAPVIMPWEPSVKAILLSYLGGEAVNGGTFDLLFGNITPSGKLSESFPLSLEDTPCYQHFAGNRMSEEYRESIFVGYRYYDTAGKAVAYPFGYGLSYTDFSYSALTVDNDTFEKGSLLRVHVTVENTGKRAGSEIVQLYIGKEQDKIFRAKRELKGFDKVFLEPGEKKTLTFLLNNRSFSYYHSPEKAWAIEGGIYTIEIGASSRDIRLTHAISVKGDQKENLFDLRQKAAAYYSLPADGILEIPENDFLSVYGAPLPKEPISGNPYTENSLLGDLRSSSFGRQIYGKFVAQIGKSFSQSEAPSEDLMRMVQAMFDEAPLRALIMMSNGAMDPVQLTSILEILNESPKDK